VDLTKLVLKKFRNYPALTWEPRSGINVLVGKNAQGKTNLLEAVYYLSTFSSPRTHTDAELVFWGQDSFYLQGFFQKKGEPFSMEAGYAAPGGPKEIRLNHQVVPRHSAALGVVHTVLFTPEDLYLVKGYPQGRRNFLDREILQVNPAYGQYLSRYTRILRQRNRLLKEMWQTAKGAKSPQLESWDQQLAETGSFILLKRKEFIKKLSLLARLQHRKLTAGQEELQIQYFSSLERLNCQDNFSREMILEIFLGGLASLAAEERNRGMTLVGPHRDDLEIRINQRPARVYGSQGQQRTAALSLKLAQVELIYGERGSYPILLLDDVFSELDRDRQKGLLSLIRGKVQTLITGTSDFLLQEEAFQDSAFYRVTEGRLALWKSSTGL
jgi:DNA replication and repair protein RecF